MVYPGTLDQNSQYVTKTFLTIANDCVVIDILLPNQNKKRNKGDQNVKRNKQEQ